MYTENSSYCHGFGNLDLATFEPFPKNPPIFKVFRENGLADELGSGMRNTYKFTQMYSGANPDFIEGDFFRTIVLLDKAAATKIIVDLGDTSQDNPKMIEKFQNGVETLLIFVLKQKLKKR